MWISRRLSALQPKKVAIGPTVSMKLLKALMQLMQWLSPLPRTLIFPYIMQALRADKAVLAEKPISHELHEVEEAVQLAKSKNLAFVCGYQRRADRHFRELKRQLNAGAIGNLKLLKTCSRDNPIPPMEYLRTSGGIFHDMLIHDFDMLDFLSGGQVPESVTATGHSYHPWNQRRWVMLTLVQWCSSIPVV